MEDSTEEFEPLFDYSRVQPVNFISLDEDDSDVSPALAPKRRKITMPTGDADKEGKKVQVVDCDDSDDEDDILPPPPKNTAPAAKREEDSAIKELRKKKEELATLVQSAEMALRAVDEASNRAATIALNSSNEPGSLEITDVSVPPKPAADRAKIVISIQDKSETKQYRIYADDKFGHLFRKYAEKAKIGLEKLVFKFDGDKIDPSSTPKKLEMEDDDIIEVNVKPN